MLKGIGFSAGAGEPITLLGPNGAGKTTLMRVICGYLAPDAGSVRICGLSYENDRAGILRQLGYMPENTPLYQEMTVFEYLRFVAGIFKMTERDFAAGVKETAVGLGIEPVLGEKIKTSPKATGGGRGSFRRCCTGRGWRFWTNRRKGLIPTRKSSSAVF